MTNPKLKQAAEQLKQAVTRLEQAKDNPQALQQAIADVKAKATAVSEEAEDA